MADENFNLKASNTYRLAFVLTGDAESTFVEE